MMHLTYESSLGWNVHGWPLLAVLLVTFMSFRVCTAQQRVVGADETIDAAKQLLIIDSVTTALDSIYVFPEKAKAMSKLAHANFKKGVYKDITSAQQFTQKLTSDLQEICHDGHFNISFVPTGPSRGTVLDTSQQVAIDAQREQERSINFGFHRLEQLEGNVGYLDLRQFCDANWSGPTAAAAMAYLANCDAIIFDLRRNPGGEPSMIQFLTSYLFEYPRHINSFYVRQNGETQQFWTQASVPGIKMPNVPVYVLTSSFTYSAAEEFTYNLKNMKRATIVGETTGGGAHPVTPVVFPTLSLVVNVPFGRAVNPITGTNWEGVGVAPDIAVPEAQALTTAHMEALKKLRESKTDPVSIARLDWGIDGLTAQLKPLSVEATTLQKYVGKYGPRLVSMQDGSLFYQREGRPKMKMIPLTQEVFSLEDLNSFRLKFVVDGSGNAKEVIGMYDDGRTDSSPRSAN